MITSIAWLIVILLVLYYVYSYLYPGSDANYTQFLNGDMNAKKPMPIKGKVPAIFTGGDFTLSMWIYIDDWNYKVNQSKFLFALSPKNVAQSSNSPLIGVLTPLQNGLMVRANTVSTGSASTTSAAPDYTKESALKNLLSSNTSAQMYSSTVTDMPCDIKEIPVQKWVNVTIVSSGRVLDVYMDGKLSRSCVLPNVLNVPTGDLKLRLGDMGGFGGRYSSVQMWNYQLTPDLIYNIYQYGPSQTQHDIFTDIAKWFGINVSFTKASGTPTDQASCSGGPSWAAAAYSRGAAGLNSFDPSSFYANLTN